MMSKVSAAGALPDRGSQNAATRARSTAIWHFVFFKEEIGTLSRLFYRPDALHRAFLTAPGRLHRTNGQIIGVHKLRIAAIPCAPWRRASAMSDGFVPPIA